jgi:hypothetical protein
MARKSKKSEWEKSLSLMSLDELYYILSTPDAYEAGYVQMAKEKLDDLANLTEHEAMKVIVQRCLEDMGCKCEIDEDGYINFWFQGSQFYIIIQAPDHYIEIYDYSWKRVSLDDTEEMYRLKLAINKANSICTITTYYEADDKAQLAYVYCTTSILFRPMVHNLRQYLYTRLSNFFLAHDIINAEMLLLKEREQVALAHSVMDVSPDDMPVC